MAFGYPSKFGGLASYTRMKGCYLLRSLDSRQMAAFALPATSILPICLGSVLRGRGSTFTTSSNLDIWSEERVVRNNQGGG